MKSAFYLLVFVMIAFTTNGQNWEWAETAGGTLPDEANGCFQDENGNMYMSGFYFSTDINFGNGNQLSNNGLSDGFIVKYNSNGSTQWASKVKGSAEDKATKCTTDRFGNVFTTGYFDSPSIQFGGNNNDNVSNSDNGGGTFDAFIVKYNASGTPQWYHSIGEEDDDGGSSVAADSAGNVYVTGWFRAESVTLSSSVSIYNTTATGPSDMFLIKYDQNGDVLWAKAAGGPDDDKGRGCAVDNDGNVVVTGYSKPSSMTIEGTVYPNYGSKDFFVIKYDTNGNLLAARTFGGSGGEEAFACSTDDAGNVYVAGGFSSSNISFDNVSITNPSSGSGVFLLKLDPDLNALWATSFSSDSNDEALGCYSDSYGNVVVTGTFSGNSLTIGNNSLNNNGGDEIFIAKYDANGNLFWAKKVGKSNDDGARDCHILDNGKVVIAGYYNSGSLTFGNIDIDNSYVIIATSDVFIASMCEAETGQHDVESCTDYTWIDGNVYSSSISGPVASFPNSNGCDSIVTLNLIINSVDVSVAQSGEMLTANSPTGTYQWLDCNNNYMPIPNETGNVYSAITSGSYAVEVTDNSCIDTSACLAVAVIPVGIRESSRSTVNLYPNPAQKDVVIQFDLPFSGVIGVYNSLGQEISGQKVSGEAIVDLHLNVDSGAYLVRIMHEDGSSVYRSLMIE